jgi:hypothetical protein
MRINISNSTVILKNKLSILDEKIHKLFLLDFSKGKESVFLHQGFLSLFFKMTVKFKMFICKNRE